MQRRSRSIQSLQIPNKISKSNARNAIATLPKVQQNAYVSQSNIEQSERTDGRRKKADRKNVKTTVEERP